MIQLPSDLGIEFSFKSLVYFLELQNLTKWSIYSAQYYSLINELNYATNDEYSKLVFFECTAEERKPTQNVAMEVLSHFKVHSSTYYVNVGNQIKYANI